MLVVETHAYLTGTEDTLTFAISNPWELNTLLTFCYRRPDDELIELKQMIFRTRLENGIDSQRHVVQTQIWKTTFSLRRTTANEHDEPQERRKHRTNAKRSAGQEKRLSNMTSHVPVAAPL